MKGEGVMKDDYTGEVFTRLRDLLEDKQVVGYEFELGTEVEVGEEGWAQHKLTGEVDLHLTLRQKPSD